MEIFGSMSSQSVNIFYLSGTGNSLKIAKDLLLGLGEGELVSIPKAMQPEAPVTIEGETIGFVFPVYFARLPVLVEEFISQADFSRTQYVFAVANGGGLFGRTLHMIDQALRRKGKLLNAGFRIKMPGNHPRITFLQSNNPEALYLKANEQTEKTIETIQRKKHYHEETARGHLGFVYSFLGGFNIPYYHSTMHDLDKYFWLNENCINCGECVSFCPVGNIRQSHRRPIWRNQCINCFACYNLCSWKAIQVRCPWKIFDADSDFTQQPRYRHPGFEPEQFFSYR
jgi:ferredoxin